MAGLYDGSEYTVRRILPIVASGGISVVGTAASDTVLVRLVLTDSITIDKVRAVAMTGGTAAGPNVKVQYSLAGTGAATTLATIAVGTSADNAALAPTVTSQAFIAGDHLLITLAAGTAASTPKLNITLGYKETFL